MTWLDDYKAEQEAKAAQREVVNKKQNLRRATTLASSRIWFETINLGSGFVVEAKGGRWLSSCSKMHMGTAPEIQYAKRYSTRNGALRSFRSLRNRLAIELEAVYWVDSDGKRAE